MDSEMVKRYLVHHAVNPGFGEAYIQATLELLRESGWEHGILQQVFFRDQSDPLRFTILEAFVSEEHDRAYRSAGPYPKWYESVVAAGMLALPEDRRAVEGLQPERPRDPGCDSSAPVSLRQVTEDNLRAVIELQVSEEQRRFVAPNERSLVQAYTAGEGAWVRAIYAGEVPVGFLMLSVDLEKPRYYLWRYMVDARYQGLGYGRRAMELLIEHVRSLPGASELFLSYVPAPGGPQGFYEKIGFRNTGVEHGRELEMRLPLD
jgi:diamine N-acetyltransferase